MAIFDRLFKRADAAETLTFDELLVTAGEELRTKTQAHCRAWRLDKADDWCFNQETGELTFVFDDGMVARAPAQIIGTFDARDRTWLWAWNNPSIDEKRRRDALAVKAYGEEAGIEKLVAAKWPAEENDAWAMAALATKLCDAQGAYRGPAGTTFVFMTFGEVKLRQEA